MFKSPLHLIVFIVNVIGDKKKPGNCHLISLCDDSVCCWLSLPHRVSRSLLMPVFPEWCWHSDLRFDCCQWTRRAKVNDAIARCPPVNVWSARRSAAARSHNVHSPQSYASHDTDEIMSCWKTSEPVTLVSASVKEGLNAFIYVTNPSGCDSTTTTASNSTIHWHHTNMKSLHTNNGNEIHRYKHDIFTRKTSRDSLSV